MAKQRKNGKIEVVKTDTMKKLAKEMWGTIEIFGEIADFVAKEQKKVDKKLNEMKKLAGQHIKYRKSQQYKNIRKRLLA